MKRHHVELRVWQGRWNLNADWCWNMAQEQLEAWHLMPELHEQRFPLVQVEYIEPVTGERLVHTFKDSEDCLSSWEKLLREFPPDQRKSIPQMLSPAPHFRRLGSDRPATELPPELCFTLGNLGDGWRMHLNEPWKDARRRLTQKLGRALTAYHKQVKRTYATQFKMLRFDAFEWLIQRVVPPVVGPEDIGLGPDDADDHEMIEQSIVSNQTLDLAELIVLHIPGSRGRHKSG